MNEKQDLAKLCTAHRQAKNAREAYRINAVILCGWIKHGKEHAIKSNTGRRRLNINGAIDVQRMSAEIRFDNTIDAVSTIELFKQIEHTNPVASCITILLLRCQA